VSHQVTAVFLCYCYPKYQHQSQFTIRHCGRLELPVIRRPVGQHSLFLVSSGASAWHLRVSVFFEPWLVCLSAANSWVLAKGSHKKPVFRMFPLSLQSIISNQMRPGRLKGAWFSRLLQHPANRQSGFILSPGSHTGWPTSLLRNTTHKLMVYKHITITATWKLTAWRNSADVI